MPILSGTSRIAGIIGWPVSHSRSPRLHGHWLDRYGIDGAYIPLPVRPEHFASAVKGVQNAGFAGANVTIPHKIAAFEICDVVEDSARRAGAVNTLVFNDGRITGSNTDGWGFLAHLRANQVALQRRPALLLGAGGAARAIAAVLLDAGVPVTVANRTPQRAERLAVDLPGLSLVPWEARTQAMREAALLVNTTSLGMHGHPPLDLPLDHASPGLVVCDIVYVPLETPLLADARARGLKAVDGLGMLLHQAVPGFHAWFGRMPEVDDQLRHFVARDLIEA
jgi:shikimate dehydrogenase